MTPHQVLTPASHYRNASQYSSPASSTFLLSNIPHSYHTPSPFFGNAAEHPFANYWTSRGGLPEVIGVLPDKGQADILVAKYFEAVDPVYPMIHRRNFYADYERFWSLPLEEKNAADPVLVGLHYVVYAMGTQFITNVSDQERKQIAEFYVSASQQALRLSGYLSRASVRTLQAMVLISYFLMNDNHYCDAWAFSGVMARQAYAMGLHRDPDIITPRCSQSDKHQRRKLWQAIFFQDTFLTVLLKLPPTTTFSDVKVESLTDEFDDYIVSQSGNSGNGTPEVAINRMSINSIVPMADAYPLSELDDRHYIRSMWHMANLVQSTICIPRALLNPLVSSVKERIVLIAKYHDLLPLFPPLLTTSDDAEIGHLAKNNPRQLRQNFFFRSNFWHCLMAIHADENKAAGVGCDVEGALNAARMALQAFFHFWKYLKVDAGVWWVFQHRAFDEALMISNILAAQDPQLVSQSVGSLLLESKEDARRTLEILEVVNSTAPVQKTKTGDLRKAFGDIPF
ncbi:hypothetical protein M011DRAFT_233199 [Sporormia fimetaria CBS 119925]|uniref:Xylanolytic transcriptional activator regulatory domain-containing protein n=1 Tax=Sporormia fimetaria CBS 119925 TaxID=1340428 RepID=A0A6A6VJB2_9PLEO|nr:hypothetical protein M011DRAFT_233199 [Sporormia fimetaria CBS 119925]